MEALGELTEEERARLEAHLATCESCAELRAELGATVEALGTSASLGTSGSPTTVPAWLTDAVLEGFGQEDTTARRRRGAIALVVGGALAAAAVILALVLGGASTPQGGGGRTLALSGRSSAHATVVLTSTAWGTSLRFTATGLAPGRTYTVSMGSEAGTWWTAGTVRPTSTNQVRATMACAATPKAIDEVTVTDDTGRVVLANYPESG
jgi:hypothetical protein